MWQAKIITESVLECGVVLKVQRPPWLYIYPMLNHSQTPVECKS